MRRQCEAGLVYLLLNLVKWEKVRFPCLYVTVVLLSGCVSFKESSTSYSAQLFYDMEVIHQGLIFLKIINNVPS